MSIGQILEKKFDFLDKIFSKKFLFSTNFIGI